MNTRRYEGTMVTLFTLAWGFLILDRQGIAFLFPILAPIFHLNNAAIGQIILVTGLGFAFASIIFSILSDKAGNKKWWLVVFLVLVGIFSGFTGLVGSVGLLIFARMFTGASEGPVYPLETSMISRICGPKKLAFNVGIIQLGATGLGGILAPIIMTQLAVHVGWRYAFIFTSIPTIIIGILIAVLAREAGGARENQDSVTEREEKVQWADFGKLFKYRNVVIAMILQILLMASFWSAISFGSLYFTKVVHMSETTMGLILGIWGAAAFVWSLIMPLIANRIGRRPTIFIFGLINAAASLVLYLAPGSLATVLFIVIISTEPFLTVMYPAIIGIESVPRNLAATSAAVIMAVGEIFGTSIAPRIMGGMADTYGLPIIFLVGTVALVVMSLVGLALIETNPHKRLAKPESAQTV